MPVLVYIHKGALPEDKFKARRLHYQAARYVVYDKVMYKRGFNQLLLRCVDEEEGNYILKEVHEGIYGNHLRGNSLTMNFFMPMILLAHDEGGCCKFRQSMRSLPALCKLFIYAGDALNTYETMPLATITAKKIRDFVFNSIVCSFGIPYKLVSDNGKQFDNKGLRQLCEDLKIKKEFTAVYHPQSNGQTEAINKIIKYTLETKLEEHKGNWPEELPKVMWSYNTTPKSTMRETPFMLTYRYEAMVPVEVGSGSLRRDRYREEDAEVNQRLHLDLLEEVRENSQLRLAAYQQRAARYYNKKVKG
ncbi:uncharacterized protein LOC141661185 [Apium graveolens]|uniref:uncharacterized protein LOC141661185 n=1 Tax=Apium graveolens TaxID=4045 RepID=UPI003D7B1A18